VSTLAIADVTAKSYIVTNGYGEIITEKNSDDVRPIASITKLMTAMIVLDAHLPLHELIPVDSQTRKTYNRNIPKSKKYLTRQELLDLALAKSDNLSAYLLCSSYPGGIDNCVSAMNEKAIMIGLHNTKFVEPTGLDRENVSTARELALLVMHAQNYPAIVESTSSPTVNVKMKKRSQKFNNTNPLVHTRNDVVVSKTGYISAAGGCLVMLLNSDVGLRVVVLLGSQSTKTRAPEAIRIAMGT
jgi:D-alanyl-D-alanine endopeptidase (penicillin-binding protein 7)